MVRGRTVDSGRGAQGCRSAIPGPWHLGWEMDSRVRMQVQKVKQTRNTLHMGCFSQPQSYGWEVSKPPNNGVDRGDTGPQAPPSGVFIPSL